MKVDVYMPWYIGDYDRDTAHLSFEEHGFYGAILRALWMRDGVLDGRDRGRLARVLRTDVATVERLWPAVEEFLCINDDGTFTQKRLSIELEKAKGLRVAASKAGQASAAARRHSTTVATEPPTDVQRPLQRDAQQDGQRKPNPSESPSPSESESGSPSPPPAEQKALRLEPVGPGSQPPALLVFPTAGSPSSWNLTARWVAETQAAFPKVDVIGEARKALTKINLGAVPKKTAGGMSKFLLSWIGRTNDSARGATGPPVRDVRVGSVPAPGPETNYPKGEQQF